MPKRIEPTLHPETGAWLDLPPPTGGSWLRDADGGLTPADKATADGAGLDWGASLALAEIAADAGAEVLTDANSGATSGGKSRR
jgi:hypothetical protein